MTNLSPTDAARRKQYALVVLVIGGIGLASALGVYFSTPSATPAGVTKKADIKTKSYIAPGEKVEPQDAWRGVADNRLALLESKITSLETENRILSGRAAKEQPTPAAGPKPTTDDEIDARLREYQKGAPPTPAAYPKDQAPITSGAQPAAPTATQPGQPQPAPKPSNGMLVITMSSEAPAKGDPIPGLASNGPDAAKPPKTAANYLPTGMFGQAILLSGMDAPTGGQAQQNPHPVLLQLRNPGILPNGFRQDWHSCHISGSGYGDMSSERAYIRTESLSCVNNKGDIVDVELKGYIVGEDGKAGVRGRLVSKQGQVLASALLAGVVSGIGSGFEKSTQVTSTSALGSTTTTKPGEEYAAGIGAGVNKALDRLANYYITLAEKLFPVVEIDAGRSIDVVLTKGVYLDGKTQ